MAENPSSAVRASLGENVRCEICGEREFETANGKFCCKLCGTVLDLVVTEVNPDDILGRHNIVKSQKIHAVKSEKANLTSWECYNYILRGFVGELLSFGAKEELKLMTLQVWAAYLRRNEAAFFSKRPSELPRLGVRYLKQDAITLYNHTKKLRLNRIRRSSSRISADTSMREHRRNVRILDKSSYSQRSSGASSQTSTSTTGAGIQLEFSSTARRYHKKAMSTKHLARHARDAAGELQCHMILPKATSLKRRQYAAETLNLKQIYAILAIALNLVEDDIQLSDLMRFIAEGHISARNVVSYFPANLAAHTKPLLADINFYSFPEKFSQQFLRSHISILANVIELREFNVPKIEQLGRRYVTELNLPEELTMSVARLINLLPPQMRTRAPRTYAPFEARAMAYIVFVLKLLFGLDGKKEQQVSQSAHKVNNKLRALRLDAAAQPALFEWSEWVQYIEMRKVIVGQYNSTFAQRFQQTVSGEQMMAELSKERRCNRQQNDLFDLEPTVNSMKIANMQVIFSSMLPNESNAPSPNELCFEPCLTPTHTYLKRILLHVDSNKAAGRAVASHAMPAYMRVNHAQRTVQPFVRTKALRCRLAEYGVRLQANKLACSVRRHYVGVFRAPVRQQKGSANFMRQQKANFTISENKWQEQCAMQQPMLGELEFKTVLDTYDRTHIWRMNKRHPPRKRPMEGVQSAAGTASGSVPSFEVFAECDMDPLAGVELNAPRYGLGSVNLFGDLSESEDEEDAALQNDDDNSVTLHTSAMDYWLLLGSVTALNELQKKTLAGKLPLSFLWLLETCAETIGEDWTVIYEQLLAIEVMFAYGIENLNEFTECLHFKYNIPIKDLNMLMNQYRDIW